MTHVTRKTPLRSVPIPDDLWEFAEEYAKKKTSLRNRSDLIRKLLEALMQGRITVERKNMPNPFPRDEFTTEDD